MSRTGGTKSRGTISKNAIKGEYMYFRKNLLVIIFMFFSVTTLFTLTLKIGSIAPRNSPWDKALKEIAAEWERISGGRIQMKIYPGGITGTEGDSIRKVRVGALDGTVLSTMERRVVVIPGEW